VNWCSPWRSNVSIGGRSQPTPEFPAIAITF
jgi:hypothetical protein